MSDEADREARIARGVRVVREGHGANCSSIGSVVDTLFATAVVGGAIYAAIAAALAKGEPRVVGDRGAPREGEVAARADDEKGEGRR
jgi:hypothetical protein